MISIVLFLLSAAQEADSFIIPSINAARTILLVTDRTKETCCWAKKTGKVNKQRGAPSSGSGFGSTTKAAGPAAVNTDYSVFPKLEKKVLETLVPSSPELMEPSPGQGIPDEIYQRLDQIYGLPNFNFREKEKEPEMSLTDMLSSSSAPEATLSSSSLKDLFGTAPSTSMGDSDLDSLLASVTGGSTTTKPLSTSTSRSAAAQSKQHSLALDRLPPFEKIRILHIDPLVVSINDFFTAQECDRYVAMSSTRTNKNVRETRSPTVGKDAAAKSQRTSTTWYHFYQNVPELMAKASRLLGLDFIDHWEEPQTVRYRRNEKFTWHLDALGPNENKAQMGGQRTATLLVYLTGLTEDEGGATIFRDLGGSSSSNGEGGEAEPLRVQPKKGSALLFFPAAGGIPNTPFDIRTLHCGQVVSDTSRQDKWIAQMWLREGPYRATAPPGNDHGDAVDAVDSYCATFVSD